MVTTSPPRPFIRVRGRSFMALVVAPEPPVGLWLETLKAQIAKAPNFFDSRPVVVDLTSMPGEGQDMAAFIAMLEENGLRIIGVEGIGPGWTNAQSWGRLPLLAAARPDQALLVPEESEPPPPPPPPPPPSLIVTDPVRSGQSVVFEHGDVTVLGFVSSGAEVIAAGSVHIYGALRGRAIAGFAGRPGARIFCRKLDAELLAIDGVYKTAEDLPQALRHHPAQAWLDDDVLRVDAL